MTTIYAIILFIFSVLAAYLATRVCFNKNYLKPTFAGFSITALASAMWSFGYGGMLIAHREEEFLIYRACGLAGLFAFLIFCQLLLCIISEAPHATYRNVTAQAVAGLVLLCYIIPPSSINIIESTNGYVTEYRNGVLSMIYIVYILLIAGSFIFLSVRMTNKKNKKRIIAFGHRLLIVETLIIAGMVVDTILPTFGINLNIPASTLLQFVGLEVIYYAVHRFNSNQLLLQNMTGYVYRSLKSPIMIFDTENCIRIANNEACRMFDFDGPAEGYAGFWSDMLKMDCPEGIAETNDTIVIDAEYKRPKKKAISCRLNIDPIFDSYHDLLGYIVVVSDMTLTVTYMHQMEESRNEALRANQAKSAFLANMSHEIRTPMNSILGFSELALQDDIDAKSRSYMTDIHDSAETLLVTINEILDISKIESGKMELVNEDYRLAKVLRAVSLIIGMQANKKGLDFSMSIDPTIPDMLHGDPSKIRAVLINLLNNGIKYTKEGSVSLKITVVCKEGDAVRLRFEVTDTGMGIKEEDLGKIFDKFQRVDMQANSTTEGTGIGLSLVQGFLGLMDGYVQVESVYGKGSNFHFEIDQLIRDPSPIVLETGVAEKRERASAKYPNVKALIVDDSGVNRKVVQMALDRLQMQTTTASSGQEAIDLCTAGDYDLILMDHMMPGMDGVEATQHIRALGRGYEQGGARKIVMLTANVMSEVKNEFQSAGFDGFLAKPMDFEEMDKLFASLQLP